MTNAQYCAWLLTALLATTACSAEPGKPTPLQGLKPLLSHTATILCPISNLEFGTLLPEID